MIYTLKWIKQNLAPVIWSAITGTIYTEDWLAAMAYRETGFLIDRYAYKHLTFDVICSLMKGDYVERKGETEKQYHGFGFWQIDIASFPEHVKSGDWKDPLKNCIQAVKVLESKRHYLQQHLPNLQGDSLERAITAAYNTGEGHVLQELSAGKDIDAYTYNHDYSKVVWQAREAYKSLT